MSYSVRTWQYFNNINDRFRNILAFLQYFLNISVLCGNEFVYRKRIQIVAQKYNELSRDVN